MKVKVKICGITNLEDALNSAAAGCDAIGFIFYKRSPRYINPLKAREITVNLPQRIIKVGVFVNASKRNILHIAKSCRLDMLQFHGRESAKFCRKFEGYKIIKVFRIKNKIDKKRISRYRTFAYLFDTYTRSAHGGTGKIFDWEMLKDTKWLKGEIFLSGGLNEDNLQEVFKVTRPDWLDVSSSLEEKPGKKDKRKLESFMRAVEKIRINRL